MSPENRSKGIAEKTHTRGLAQPVHLLAFVLRPRRVRLDVTQLSKPTLLTRAEGVEDYPRGRGWGRPSPTRLTKTEYIRASENWIRVAQVRAKAAERRPTTSATIGSELGTRRQPVALVQPNDGGM